MKSPSYLSYIPRAARLYLCICYLIVGCSVARGALLSASANSQPLAANSTATQKDSVIIPGPLRSFLRMAGISQKVSKDDVLALLARNVYLRGYQQNTPTEFLILIDRYVAQARELEVLAGSSSTIRVAGCDDAGTLVQIFGYRLRGGWGRENVWCRPGHP